MVAAGIELKRLGLASKPMFAVPNHMLAQFSSEPWADVAPRPLSMNNFGAPIRG